MLFIAQLCSSFHEDLESREGEGSCTNQPQPGKPHLGQPLLLLLEGECTKGNLFNVNIHV